MRSSARHDSTESARGFLLQASYRLEAGRPVVHLHGRLSSGERFLARDRREVPHFFVRAADEDRARAEGAAPLSTTDRMTFAREPVLRVEVPVPMAAAELEQRLAAAGVVSFEADVRFAQRYLMDRGIRGALEITGPSRPGEDGIDVVFEDPAVAPASWAPRLEALSFDIETDPQARRLLSVSLHGCGASEVLLLTPRGFSCTEGAIPFATEADLLAAFCRRVRELDPDVLTGWNVIDFDLTVLDRIAARLEVPLELGRGRGALHLQTARTPWLSSRASIPGRVVIDGIQLLRGAAVRMEEYSLDFVARAVLGEGKTIAGHDRAEEILRTFKEDRPRFVAYNLKDARLVLDILSRLRLIDLAVEHSLLTGLTPDRIGSSVAAFEFLYISELARRGFVAPSARPRSSENAGRSPPSPSPSPSPSPATEPEPEPETMMMGGHVLEPEPGLYQNVFVFDFKSLYPSLIRTFHIDPLGYFPNPGPEDDPILAPNGAAFRREAGILPGLLDELFPRREAAKAIGDAVSSQAIKILMNSFYGVLGTSACRFFNAEIANAITSFGRDILLWSKEHMEARGHRVVYGDTDSLFVVSGVPDPGEARAAGQELCAALNRDLATYIGVTWRVESRLELELDALYLRLLLLPLRHGTGGARKRYAGLVEERSRGPGGAESVQERVVFTGMEAVRRDATELAKQVQRELYDRLFRDRPVESYLREVIADLRAGRLNDLLIYRKALRKGLDAYTATTPPHVAAARKMASTPGRLVSYVVTESGPEPLGEVKSAIDHEHYVQKQVRPVAEPVLSLLGLEFDDVIGDPVQLDLF
jgi:DNA polymerase-2